MNTVEFQTALQTVSKAVAGAIVTALVALGARYGFNADQSTQDALGFIITTLIGAGVGFMGVYIAPKNREIKKESK